jgi:undecaprenyl-diphosphatase
VIANVFALVETLRRPRRGPRAWPSWPPHGRLLIGTLAAVFILTLILVLTDAWAIENARTLPAWASRLFAVITDYGKSNWFLVPLAVALGGLALLVGPRLGRAAELLWLSIAVRLIFMFAAIGLPGLFVTILKRLIGRARPFVGGEADPYLFAPLGWSAKFASLPSGHSTTAFAAAVAVGALWPRARPFMWCFAVLIGVSRVAVIAHHPSDVIAGALAGTIGAILVRDWFAVRRLGFVIADDGLVRAKPMPAVARLKRLAARLFGH